MLHFDYIYLQNKFSKNEVNYNFHSLHQIFKMIITDSKKEYQSFVSYNYGYYKTSIKLTGFSRYDNLQRLKKHKQSERIILIVPAWTINNKKASAFFVNDSKSSSLFEIDQYFEFYNKLINNKKLLKTMRKLNYKGYFCIHPSLLYHSIAVLLILDRQHIF